MRPDPQTTDVSLKRKAEAAGIHDGGENAKQCKLEFIDFHTQMQRKRPGRPSKGYQRPKKAIKGFRTNRPVAAKLTRGDIWCHILENSPLSQLFRMRDVFRHYLLRWPNIWKTARRNTYGQDHPDPPPGINERQYADLLVGFGCQAKGCKDTRTRKVYWAFQRRWCVACMKKNVAMVSSDSLSHNGTCVTIWHRTPAAISFSRITQISPRVFHEPPLTSMDITHAPLALGTMANIRARSAMEKMRDLHGSNKATRTR